MYRLAQGREGEDKSLIIGERPLSTESGLSVSNVSNFLTTLAVKLAIENRGKVEKNRGTLFLVRSCENIERARREAGWTHVVRKGRSVTLTDANGNPPSS